MIYGSCMKNQKQNEILFPSFFTFLSPNKKVFFQEINQIFDHKEDVIFIILVIIFINRMVPQDFYEQYLTQLIKQIPPSQVQEIIAIGSLYPQSYLKYFQNLKKMKNKQKKQIPTRYQTANKYNILDFGGNLLLSHSENSRAALINLLYVTGQAKKTIFILAIPYNSEPKIMKKRIRQSVDEYILSFQKKLFGKHEILNSFGLLIYDIVGKNKSEFIKSIIEELFQAEKNKTTQKILFQLKNKVYFLDKEMYIDDAIIDKMTKMKGASLSPATRKSILEVSIEEGQKQKRSEVLEQNLTYFLKTFSKFCSLIEDSFEEILDPLSKEQAIDKLEKLMRPKFKNLLTHRNHVQKEGNHLIKMLNALFEIYPLKIKADEMFKNHSVEGEKLNQFIIFYELIVILCKWGIICDVSYLQESQIFLLAAFVKICSETFPYISIVEDVQIKINKTLPNLLQILTIKVIEDLEKESDRLFKREKPSFPLFPFLKLIEKLTRQMRKMQEEQDLEKLFLPGRRIINRISLLQAEFTYHYFFNILEFSNTNERLQWAILCEKRLRELSFFIHKGERKSFMLKKVYLTLAEQFSKASKYFFCSKLYKAAHGYFSYVSTAKLWLKSRDCSVQEVLEVARNFVGYGLMNEAKKIIHSSLASVSDLEQKQELIKELQSIMNEDLEQEHMAFLYSISKLKVNFIPENEMQAITEAVEELRRNSVI